MKINSLSKKIIMLSLIIITPWTMEDAPMKKPMTVDAPMQIEMTNYPQISESIDEWQQSSLVDNINNDFVMKNNDSSEIDTLLNKTKNNKSVYNSLLKYIKFTQDVLNVFPNSFFLLFSNVDFFLLFTSMGFFFETIISCYIICKYLFLI